MNRKGILRNASTFERWRPTPRFLIPDEINKAQASHTGSKLTPTPVYGRRRHHKATQPFTIPAILAQLTKEYSEEQLIRVPPVFMPSYNGGTASLGEPYAVTLRRAVDRDPSALVKNCNNRGGKADDTENRRSPPRVTFAKWYVLIFLLDIPV